MKTLIFLDDERDPEDVYWINYPKYKQIIVYKHHEEFTNFCDNIFGGSISNLNFDTLDFSFDHDIQSYDKYGNEWTGYSCLKYLLEITYLINLKSNYSGLGNINNSSFFFHTNNPVGKENMKHYYNNFKQHILDNYGPK